MGLKPARYSGHVDELDRILGRIEQCDCFHGSTMQGARVDDAGASFVAVIANVGMAVEQVIVILRCDELAEQAMVIAMQDGDSLIGEGEIRHGVLRAQAEVAAVPEQGLAVVIGVSHHKGGVEAGELVEHALRADIATMDEVFCAAAVQEPDRVGCNGVTPVCVAENSDEHGWQGYRESSAVGTMRAKKGCTVKDFTVQPGGGGNEACSQPVRWLAALGFCLKMSDQLVIDGSLDTMRIKGCARSTTGGGLARLTGVVEGEGSAFPLGNRCFSAAAVMPAEAVSGGAFRRVAMKDAAIALAVPNNCADPDHHESFSPPDTTDHGSRFLGLRRRVDVSARCRL